MDAGRTCTATFIVGFAGEYYNNSDLTGLSLVRTDPVIAFDWGIGSPDLAIEISGSPFAMSYESGDYAGGAIYSFSKTLAAGADYTYYFDAVDNTGRQAVATPVKPTPTAPVDAPDVAGVLSNTLTVAKAGTGGGTITSNLAGINCGTDCQEIYNHETVVTLTATPDSSSTFAVLSFAIQSKIEIRSSMATGR